MVESSRKALQSLLTGFWEPIPSDFERMPCLILIFSYLTQEHECPKPTGGADALPAQNTPNLSPTVFRE